MRIRWIPFWRTTSRASFWNGPTRFQNSLVDLHWVCHSDGGGAWQGFCWGAEQREQPWSNDWDQVLGRKGEETQVGKLVWFLFFHCFFCSAPTSSPSLSRWRLTRQERWRQFSMSLTVHTILVSGGQKTLHVILHMVGDIKGVKASLKDNVSQCRLCA